MSNIMEKKEWKKNDEELLKEWSDHAKIFRYMCDQARMKYRKINIYFTIPVIVLSTLTGAANFAQDKLPESYRDTFAMSIGGINILAGTIATIHSFLKISELYEGFKASSIAWAKYYHNVKTELQKMPEDRENPYDFLKWAKNEYEKLVEQNPAMPKNTILSFKNKLNKSKVSNMHLPPIVSVFDDFELHEHEAMKEDNLGTVLNNIDSADDFAQTFAENILSIDELRNNIENVGDENV